MNSEICNSNSYIKPIEVCSAKALNLLYNNNKRTDIYPNELFERNNTKIFNNNFINRFSDLNSNFRDSDNNNYIYNYNNKKKDLCFTPKNDNNKNNPYIVNCVISTNNPYFTYDNKTKSCSLIPDLILPENFYYKYEKNNTYIYYKNNDEEENNHLFKMKNEKAFCENKWYDWFVIPNYHFGNQYEKDTGMYSKQDIRRCYKPCGRGLMPYMDINGSNICVKKNLVSNGIYGKKIDYSPLALINLIGNSSKENLINLYYLMSLYEYNKYLDNDNNYSLNNNNIIDINNINNNNEISNAINEINQSIWINIINEPRFNITDYDKNDDVLTYKNPYFEENDEKLLLLRELLNYNLLTDAILLHTISLAYKYYIFITQYVFEKSNYYDKNDNNILNYDETIKNNKYNLYNNLDNLLSDKLSNKDNTEKKNFLQRLANIFYKAINVCYNNKTPFSKNILLKTKKAIENYYNNPYIKDKYSEYNINFQNDLNNINFNIINNGFEIEFYDENTYLTIKDKYKEDISNSININNKTQKEKNIINIKNYINNNLLFFRIENNEIKNSCKINQIRNKDNICVSCDTYCINHKDNNKNTCKYDDKCKLFCSDSCKTIEDNNNFNSKTCGKINTNKNEKTIINNNNIKTPLEDEELSIFPNIFTSINTGVRIFFIIVIIYLCYIFYEIFGETILTIINIIWYGLIYIGYLFWYYLLGGFNTKLFNKELNDYKLQIAESKLKRISKIKFM